VAVATEDSIAAAPGPFRMGHANRALFDVRSVEQHATPRRRREPSQAAEIVAITDSSIARITGTFGVACVLLSWAQFPLWVIGGAPPFYDSEALARHLSDIRTTALVRILMDQGIYVSMMIFAAGFRHLVRRARPESDWLGLLALVSAAVWLAVTLAADGLMGGAVLATLQGTSDVSAALPLVFGTLLIYNGSIAFAITGLFMAAAGWATLDSGVLPRWTGWIAWISAVLCALSIPAMFAGPAEASGFYNPGGWGPAIIANFPPLIWFLIVGVVLIRQSRSMN